MNKERYVHLNKYLKDKYNERVLKICIDGGFTCPNRDGFCGKKGCIYCSEKGSGEHIKDGSIKEQVINHLNSYKGKRANKFIAYFQNFTNTYDKVSNLKKKYDEALCDERIIILAIATRPDCIDENIVKLIASYKSKVDVWVELGLQTADENIAHFINRGYENNVFTKAVELLNKYDIPVVVHIMLGLPKENKESIDKTIDFINQHKIFGIKIHSTYVVKNTVLAELYNKGKYNVLNLDKYIENACYILTKINKDIVIHRISGDAPKDLLVAPMWNAHKKWIMNGIDKYMESNNLYQGMNYHEK